jgi:uncharacterized membrane protein
MEITVKKFKVKNLIILISAIGFLMSIYLFYIDLKQEKTFCLSQSGCDLVLQSIYSKFLGIPVALYGVFYFGLILVLVNFRKLFLFLKIISFLGFLFALYLIYLQAFVIKSFCQYCLIADSAGILIFILSLLLNEKIDNFCFCYVL